MNKVSRLLMCIVTLAMLVAFSLAGSSRGFAQGQATAGGTWTPLVNAMPESIATFLLLSDGTVMGLGYNNNTWYRLTPDIHGSYVNGA